MLKLDTRETAYHPVKLKIDMLKNAELKGKNSSSFRYIFCEAE